MSLRRYGPGKFDTLLDAYVYTVSMDGVDEEIGESDTTGWYGYIYGGPIFVDRVVEAAAAGGEPLTEHERVFLSTVRGGVIVSENSQGFITVGYYTGRRGLERQWQEILKEIEEIESESEEGDYD